MPYLVAAVVLLTVLCLLNLLLTLGVIRRLRGTGGPPADDLLLPPGARVPEFTAVTTAGEALTCDSVRGAVVGFFSPDCGACATQLPRFAALAGDVHAVAVLHGGPEETRAQREALGAATVVVEEPGGPAGTAFAVSAYPTFALVDADGVVTATSFAVDRIPIPAAAETV